MILQLNKFQPGPPPRIITAIPQLFDFAHYKRSAAGLEIISGQTITTSPSSTAFTLRKSKGLPCGVFGCSTAGLEIIFVSIIAFPPAAPLRGAAVPLIMYAIAMIDLDDLR